MGSLGWKNAFSSATYLSSPSWLCDSTLCRRRVLSNLPVDNFGSKQLGRTFSPSSAVLAEPVSLPEEGTEGVIHQNSVVQTGLEGSMGFSTRER